MNKHSIGISTDSACDMSEKVALENDVAIIRFYVIADTGVFRDHEEITAQNVVEYYEKGKEALITTEPSVEEYAEFFRDQLLTCDELIHITVSSGVSESYDRSMLALGLLGKDAKKIHVIDSGSGSAGAALLVLKAAQMRNGGSEAKSITTAIETMRDKVIMTFISRNPAEMYRNGLMGRAAERICSILNLHPVFSIRHGRVVVCGVGLGEMEHCAMRFVKRRLKHSADIETSLLYITHVGFSVGMMNEVRTTVDKLASFDEVMVADASATIAANCGSQTIGMVFMRKR